MEECLELLIAISLVEKLRFFMQNDLPTIAIVTELFEEMLKLLVREPFALANYLIYLSNLCHGSSKLKQTIEQSLDRNLQVLNTLFSN